MGKPQPMQEIRWDGKGVIRFRENAIVRALLDFATNRPEPDRMSLNEIARTSFSREDREQFAQLIGYSVSGFGELSYVKPSTLAKADAIAAKVAKTRERKKSPSPRSQP